MRRAWMLFFLVAGCGSRGPGSSPPSSSDGGSSPGPTSDAGSVSGDAGSPSVDAGEDCLARADRLVEGWRSEGLAQDVIEQRYRIALAGCAGSDVDPVLASLIGRVNFDYTLLARRVIARTLDAPTYVGLVRDRSRKRRLAKDPAWLAAYARGDEDGDLIPDELDRCPRTPPLTATDDRGCPATPIVRVGGTADELRRYFELVGLVAGMGCEGAPLPQTPLPLRAGRSPAGRTMVAVSRVRNQPPGCPLMFEIEGSYYGTEQTGPLTLNIINMPIHLVLRSGDAIDPNADPQVFVARGGDTAFLANPQLPLGAYSLVWRARAMNGAGLLSAWSAMRTTLDFSLR